MFVRRRQTKKLRQIARMLQAIEAAHTRPATPRRSRAVVSRA